MAGLTAGAVWCRGEVEQTSSTNHPPAREIVRRAVAAAEREQEREAEFEARYAYIKVSVTEKRDGDGEVKAREEKSQAHQPASVPSGDSAPAAAAGARKKGGDRRDVRLNEDLSGRFDYAWVGTETLEGRPVWVIDFIPKREGAPARNLRDRFINRCSGRLWIDQQEEVLAKVSLRLTEEVAMWGGLAGNLRRFSAVLEKSRVPEGYWYARRVEWHLEGRQVLVTRRVDYREERREVRPAK
jgi:hypothetical protein